MSKLAEASKIDMTPMEEKTEGWDHHDIQHAADTLVKAEKIKKNPHLMEHVRKHVGKTVTAYKSVKELRKKSAELLGGKKDNESREKDSDDEMGEGEQ